MNPQCLSTDVRRATARLCSGRDISEPGRGAERGQGLRSRGLPMRIAVHSRDGQEYRIVLAGPFPTRAAVDAAIGQVRQLGYGAARSARF